MSFPKIEGYVFTEKLGSGSYSTVYRAYTKIGARTTVAIKCIDKSRVKHSGAAVDNLICEIRLMKTLSHPHIVLMREFTWDDRNIYIIMEYCCGGDLSKYICRYGRISEYKVLYFLQQLASALKYLREKGVAHMDLKPHNLLLHKDSEGHYVLKVGDFGFAQHMSVEGGGARGVRGVRGSPLYMAPEVLRGHYDARADLWSTGVIMYECLFGKAPYSSNTFNELVDKIQKQAPIHIPPNWPVSPGCRELLSRLLQHDPDQRISYDEFFAHEYLDLDHMPTRDSYLLAVSLARRAVAADSAGGARDALALYTAALRRLVPLARRTPALRHALARYMDRAEELKKFLKAQSCDVTSGETSTPACCPSDASDVNQELSDCDDMFVANVNAQDAGEAGHASEAAPAEKPRGFARFLKLPLPKLDRRHSIDEDKKTDKLEDVGDACRIA